MEGEKTEDCEDDVDVARLAEFSVALRAIREAHRISQKDLGIAMSELSKELDPNGPIPEQTIRSWEAGERFPRAYYAYLLCELFRKPPEALALDTVLTPRAMAGVLARIAEGKDFAEVRRMLRHVRLGLTDRSTGARPFRDPDDMDWERLGATLRSTVRVDARIIEDQWKLTRRYLGQRRILLARTMVDTLSEHISRLRHLLGMASDGRCRRELGTMIGQCTVAASQLCQGLGDFGLAMQGYRYVTRLANGMSDQGLLTVALISQALVYASVPHPQLPSAPFRMVKLLDDAAPFVDLERSPQVRAWIYASRSTLHALLDETDAAKRDLELAQRVAAYLEPDAEQFYGWTDRHYPLIHAAGVATLLERPDQAIDLYQRARSEIDEDARPIRAWLTTDLAAAYVRAGVVDLAGPTLMEALRLVRSVDAMLLESTIQVLARHELAVHVGHSALDGLEEELSADVEEDIDVAGSH